jgi:integrase/recombinase XerD
MIQLKVVNDTRKPKADGTCPIYYRITEKKKVAYIYSGFAILPTQWDENKNQVKKSHPNAQTINSSISKRYFELQKAIIELQDDELYSLDSLKEKIAPKKLMSYFLTNDGLFTMNVKQVTLYERLTGFNNGLLNL